MREKGKKTLRQRAKVSIQRYVRVRDADNNGWCKCITCGKDIFWNNGCQGGHMIPARIENTCFNEKNINSQCGKCNRFGMQLLEVLKVYAQRIDLKFGKGTYHELKEKSLQKQEIRSDSDYRVIQRHYDKKAKDLAVKKGLINLKP